MSQGQHRHSNLLLFIGTVVLALQLSLPSGLYPAAAQNADGTSPRKLALLVGVNKYDRGKPKEYHDLHTEVDIEEMRKVLVEKFGFRDEDVRVLTSPEETTKKNILGQFRTHLVEQTSPGDVAVFHYSGHGDQMLDDDGDEFDGLDESFVPSDYVSVEDHSKHIRDDEMKVLLGELKQREPANITIFFDSCHSGTATRSNPNSGRMRVRGRGWQGPPPEARTRGKGEAGGAHLGQSRGRAEGYVLITAARADQTAKELPMGEGPAMGVFTHHLIRALRGATSSTTYRDLFERLNYTMANDAINQNPQMEGDIDKMLLAGTALPQPRYVRVQDVKDDIVRLEAGSLHGATKGSRYGLYRAGTYDFADEANLLVEVEVVGVRPTLCYTRIPAEYSGKFTAEELGTARAVETAHHYGDNRLKVRLDERLRGPDAPVPARAVERLFDELEIAQLQSETATSRGRESAAEADWDVEVSPGTEGSRYVLERHDGSVLAVVETGNADQALAGVRQALEGEARWQMVKKLDNARPSGRVQIELRLVEVEVEETYEGVSWVADGEQHYEGGTLILQEGDYLMIELRNTGSVDCYVTVLDLRPDGKIGPIWPHPLADAYVDDNKILADGAWQRIDEPFIFAMGAPYGTEVFKVIATQEPTDFSALLDEETLTRGGGAAVDDSPLGQLLQQAVTNKRGGQLAGKISPASWTTDAVMFEIRP